MSSTEKIVGLLSTVSASSAHAWIASPLGLCLYECSLDIIWDVVNLISKSNSWPCGKPASPQISVPSQALLLHASAPYTCVHVWCPASSLCQFRNKLKHLMYFVPKKSTQATLANEMHAEMFRSVLMSATYLEMRQKIRWIDVDRGCIDE